SGGILSAMMLVTMPLQSKLGFDHGELIGYATMVAAALLIYFGVRSYRDNVAGGTVGFGRGLAVALLIGTIASVCYVATWEVLYFGFMPDFGEKYAAHQIDRLRASGAPQAEIDRQVEEMRRFAQMYRNPLVNVAYTFLEPMPVEVLVSLVSAGVLSRKRRRGDAAVAPA
ncbi:MAG TPA: DUF4199 domain-containing protein, partial [Polyangiaceae bacterium]